MLWEKTVCPLHGREPEAVLMSRGWRCRQARESEAGGQKVRDTLNAAVIKNKTLKMMRVALGQ